MERLQATIRTKTIAELNKWIEQARTSLIAPLARGFANDVAAIRAAITESWSNSHTEGQITRLKLVKRQTRGEAHGYRMMLKRQWEMRQAQFWTPIYSRRCCDNVCTAG